MNPPTFTAQLQAAIKAWTTFKKAEFDVPEELASFESPSLEEGSDRITADSKIFLSLPESEPFEITVSDFISIVSELSSATLELNTYCRTAQRLLIRLEPINEKAHILLTHYLREPENTAEAEARQRIVQLKERLSAMDHVDSLYADLSKECDKKLSAYSKARSQYFTQTLDLKGNNVNVRLVHGLTIFGIMVAAEGSYSEYYPPVSSDDCFIEIISNKKLTREEEQASAEALLFELSSSLDVDFNIVARADYDDDWMGEQVSAINPYNLRLRPLLTGKGMGELLQINRRGLTTPEPEYQILTFTKVIEHVSRTVIRLRANELIRAKLLSSRALEPDAHFIIELEQLVDEQRDFKKDKEAIKQTIQTCCNALEVVSGLSFMLPKIASDTFKSDSKQQEEVLIQFAAAVTATRNAIAHAKANYKATGDECPAEYYVQFAVALRIAAQQTIRWYYSQPEANRIV